ncbi:MAG: hypothetical protein AB9869_32340 [Verrucomicrobiia bacterium]
MHSSRPLPSRRTFRHLKSTHTSLLRKLVWAVCTGWLCLISLQVRSGDVLDFSILKGQFLLQTDADTLILDPDFAFSFLATVDLADYDLLREASLRLPDGDELPMDDLGDFWSVFDTANTLEELDEYYTWGDYFFLYNTVNDGNFTCLLNLPEAPLPPKPRLVNFADAQAVNVTKPLTLVWEFDGPPKTSDFVQIYVSLGHWDVFSTPALGEPGALDGTARSFTIPANTLDPDWIQSLNIEITRLVSTNNECNPKTPGVGATFSSTEVDLVPIWVPVLRVASAPANGQFSIEVSAEPQQPIVLIGSSKLIEWSPVATNSSPSGIVVFSVPLGEAPFRFFSARQP